MLYARSNDLTIYMYALCVALCIVSMLANIEVDIMGLYLQQ